MKKSNLSGDNVKERQKNKAMHNELAASSSGRARMVMLALGVIQFIQMLLYMFSSSITYVSTALIVVKMIVVILIIVFYVTISMMERGNQVLRDHAVLIMTILSSAFLAWAIANTLIAQHISSDITIFILMLFCIAAIIVIKPRILISIYAFGYLVFIFLLPLFESNKNYVFSHRVNGLMMIFLASIISGTLYKYGIKAYNDRQDIKKKNEHLLYLAQRDGLTGLYNHKTMHEMLDDCLRSMETKEQELYLLLLDLDNFKQINDSYGHKTGDQALILVADVIKEVFNEYAMLGRYGGDEFMLIMSNVTHQQAVSRANELLKLVADIKFKDIQLTFSCGIVKWKNETADRLVETADQLMYKSKDNGRNQVSI